MWQQWITNYWAWIILGLSLVIVEIFVLPTTWFLWFGISAFFTAILVALFPALDWEWVLFFYALVSLAAVMVGRRYVKLKDSNDEAARSNLNRRTRQYIGREVTLVQPLINGVGRAKLGDTTWRVEGPDAPAGAAMRVIDVNGATLVVMPDDSAPRPE